MYIKLVNNKNMRYFRVHVFADIKESRKYFVKVCMSKFSHYAVCHREPQGRPDYVASCISSLNIVK